jgi:bifunctional UDP-N-acetylglucosamine pyrophosphorylase/glucosamine-1-phosphate N-acetyltransferase
VIQALPALQGVAKVLVLYGDVPLIRPETLQSLVAATASSPLALLATRLDDPSGYGRMVRDDRERLLRIVEHKDANPEELAIHEVNTGILCCERQQLTQWLGRIGNDNVQGEHYLTDIVGLAVADGYQVAAVRAADPMEVTGINDRCQLAAIERAFQARQADRLMRAGVTLMDPARFDLRGELEVGRDLVIDVNVVLEGEVSLADGVCIGANTVIRNSHLGPGVQVLENCVIEDARIGAGSRIGPFARIRPDTELAEQVHIGNFVEIKKSHVASGSKINHLSYIGDATVGSGVNIGAGTITCNYDGANKHRTTIGDRAFIGSDTQLVAPVEVGPGATIGAGSTITRNAPADQLTLSRTRQFTIEGWHRPVKQPKIKE